MDLHENQRGVRAQIRVSQPKPEGCFLAGQLSLSARNKEGREAGFTLTVLSAQDIRPSLSVLRTRLAVSVHRARGTPSQGCLHTT